MFFSAAWLATNVGFGVWWFCIFRPVRLLPTSVPDVRVRRATIQILSGAALYAGTTVISYWFPMSALIIISASEKLWIVMSVDTAVDE